jgi:hypothetical protein
MHNVRLLGLAIRARWLGFSALDARGHLLDWGLLFYQRRRSNELQSAKKRFEGLFDRTNPTVVVVVLPRLKTHEDIITTRLIVRSLRSAASSLSVRIVRLRRDAIRAAFAPYNARSKHEIAVVLAQLFPELGWKLPSERKIWTKEDPKMAIFDALAGGVAYHKAKVGNTAPVSD